MLVVDGRGQRDLITWFKRISTGHLEIFLELRTLSYAVSRQDCCGNLNSVFLGKNNTASIKDFETLAVLSQFHPTVGNGFTLGKLEKLYFYKKLFSKMWRTKL